MTEKLRGFPVLKASIGEAWVRRNEFLRITWFPFLLLFVSMAVFQKYAAYLMYSLSFQITVGGQPYTVLPGIFIQIALSATFSAFVVIPLLKKVIDGVQPRMRSLDLGLGLGLGLGGPMNAVCLSIPFSPGRGEFRFGLIEAVVYSFYYALKMVLVVCFYSLLSKRFPSFSALYAEFLSSFAIFIPWMIFMAWAFFALVYAGVARDFKWAVFVRALRLSKGMIVPVAIIGYLIFLPYYLLGILELYILGPMGKDYLGAIYGAFYVSLFVFYACQMVWAVFAGHLFRRFAAHLEIERV